MMENFCFTVLTRKRFLVSLLSLAHKLIKSCPFGCQGASLNYRLLLEKSCRNKVNSIRQVSTRIRTVKGESGRFQAAGTTKEREGLARISLRSHPHLTTQNNKSATILSTQPKNSISGAAYLITTPHSKSPPEVLEYPPLACLPLPFSSKS